MFDFDTIDKFTSDEEIEKRFLNEYLVGFKYLITVCSVKGKNGEK
jgi:hypothetical protein